VAVTGMVEKFAEISPERVLLKGNVGEPIQVDVVIIPRKEYPFTIEHLRARKGNLRSKKGKFFQYELKERCTDGNNRCVIRVKNTLPQKGRYADVLDVTTDSKIRPNIPIYIIGMIQ